MQEEIASNKAVIVSHDKDRNTLEIEIQDLLSRLDDKDQTIHELKESQKKLQQSIDIKAKTQQNQLTKHMRSENQLKVYLSEQGESLETITSENKHLKDKCAQLIQQVSELERSQEEAQNEGMEWERALNEAVSMTQKQYEQSRREFENEKCELLETIQSKENQIAQLQL